MKLHSIVLATLAAVIIAYPVQASEKLSQIQSSARLSLAQYGYTNVDVAQLNPSQLAQIQFLTGSGSGVGRIRGQLGAILRQSHVWDLQRKTSK